MMRSFRRGLAAVVLGLGVTLAASVPSLASGLALDRVMLSSGGVGYFEYRASVTGDATLSLDVPLDQVDDVLKSLVVYDAGGTAGEITLPGREPLSRAFTDLPFGRSAFDSEAELLNALQGAEVRITGPKPMSGRLVRVVKESARGPDRLFVTRHRVAVLTDKGLQQFVLEDADDVSFADPALQKKLEAALSRIAQEGSGGRRQLTLTLHGKGERQVRVGYVVPVPLWKATYRLTLPAAAKAGTARLQGWAVLENVSGRPWHGVQLTLLSGNPVTFRQALYESYYVKRPTVPVEVVGRVLPPPDTGTMPLRLEASRQAPAPLPRGALKAAPRGAGAMAASAPPPAAIEAATASDEATQIAFTLPSKVDAPAGESLVVPIMDRTLPARRVDLYQPATDARHPLAAIALTNDSGSGLPPGVLTLYEETPDKGFHYVGDARLATFPRGDKRLLSYAVDGRVTIDRDVAERRLIAKATVAQGVMRVTRLLRQTTTYRAQAAPGASPALIVEQPRHPGWTLSAPDPKTVEMTAGAYRIPVALDAKGGAMLTVSEQHPIAETIRILDLSDDQLGTFVTAPEIDPALRKALAEIAARRRSVGEQRAELARLKQHREQLVQDEGRLRAIISTLDKESALRRQTIDKLGDTENRIEKLSDTLAKATTTLATAEQKLNDFVAALAL